LPGIELPPRIQVTADPATLATATDLVMYAVPSAHLRASVERTAAAIPASADVLSVVKGLENETLLRMTEVIADASGSAGAPIEAARVAALSGPNLAQEIARGLPASAVVASADPELGDRIVARLSRREFRLYTNPDVLGVELCGALKNIVAIAAGANPLTFAGLAGIGDVIATCGSKLSRNHRLGEELAKGRPWSEIEASLPGVAEGAYTVDAALALAARHGVEMPIAQEVHNALFEGKSVQRCLIDLLSRESKDELADFQRWIDRLNVTD
jgi:glycerol-3-phosphate dehydrogenase (NAD(P)+)